MREHHSFVELPALDGSYSAARGRPAGRLVRHRVQRLRVADLLADREAVDRAAPAAKEGPGGRGLATRSKPIVYYVDNGAPEPIRGALVEGASWWNQAFEAAGFRNAFQVKVLPEDADPMDLRYNMINWVHRSTRGWSYGGSVVDPRTGEILKGNVTLGSLRVRQDYLLGSGLVPHGRMAAGVAPRPRARCPTCMPSTSRAISATCRSSTTWPTLDPATDAAAMSLARIRQLSAHEVGHTLGFAHNFAASTYGRASVMDYPAPAVEDQGRAGWICRTPTARRSARSTSSPCSYAYAQFAPGADEDRRTRSGWSTRRRGRHALRRRRGRAPRGRRTPAGQPVGQRRDPVATLRHEMEVRRIGLSRVRPRPASRTGRRSRMLEAKLAAAVPAPPLPAAGGGQVARRALLHLLGEDSRRAAAEARRGDRPAARRSARRSARCSTRSRWTNCCCPRGSST